MPKKKIFYVDDCDANLRLVEKSLSKDYDVATIDSPGLCLNRLKDTPPDLLLLDVNMPETDGYEVCRRIRQNDQLKDIPVVFLTCRATLEDRLRGFEVGGDAYVTKPFQLSELKSIVRAQINRHQRMIDINDRVSSSNEMIGMLMQNCSETGSVLQYARELSKATDESDLLDITFRSLEQFNLQSTVCLKTDAGDIVARCDRQPIVTLEVNLLEMARNGPRIANAGNKYIFNGERSIFLIKNMPTENDELSGRLRDHLALMLELCDACVERINLRQREQIVQQHAAKHAQSTLYTEFKQILGQLRSFNAETSQAFDELATKLEKSFIFIGLTEEQEEQISQYVKETRARIDKVLDVGADIQDAMARVSESVEALTTQRRGTLPNAK